GLSALPRWSNIPGSKYQENAEVVLDPRARECRLAMRNATDYSTWREAANEFDRVTGRADWKQEEESDQYDWKLVKNRLRQIRQLREDGKGAKLVHHLRQ